MDMPRRAVITALMKQEQDGYANLVLAHALEAFSADSQSRDRAFISAAFYGTVERTITLDYILQKYLTKPLQKLDAEVRAILRSGLYQARYMDSVPVSAAVNEAVTLTRKLGKGSAAGMVNAVLRKASAYHFSSEVWESETQRLQILYSISSQIAALLAEKLPHDCEAFLRASFVSPQLCVRVNTLQTTVEAMEETFAKQGVATQRGQVPNSLYVAYKGDITATKLFKHGCFHVQSEASQLACCALGAKPGETVLDLCAAPGGKSATLAQYMQNEGLLFSCDAAQNRLSLVEALLARTGATCAQVLRNDASAFRAKFEGRSLEAQADAILCDVPCSGLGVLAKKPDIRMKTLEGLDALIALQSSILETSARYLKHGGRLVYSTCTVNPDENENVVRAFLGVHPEFTAVLPPKNYLPEGARIGIAENANFVTTLPFLGKTDGFFVALLQKL